MFRRSWLPCLAWAWLLFAIACGSPEPVGGQDDAGLPDAAALDAGLPSSDASVADAGDESDASVPVDDGNPTRVACTSRFGSALTDTHGRLDGYLVSIVQPGSSRCNGDDSHMHLQIRMNGSIYDVAVNVGAAYGTDDVFYVEKDEPLVDGTWSEGWHPGYSLDYVGLGVHSGELAALSKSALTKKLNGSLADANHVSIYATGYGHDGAHLVHRNGYGRDGAVVIRPLSGAPRYLMFRFSDQSF
jgi:hypothetical protein